MKEQIILKVILTIVGFFVTSILGYLTATLKNYRTREKVQEEALKCLLRSQITSKYYVYSEIGEIPYYEKENLNYMFEQYKKMQGNSYVAGIMSEINKLSVKK